jgi:hypothetical protein
LIQTFKIQKQQKKVIKYGSEAAKKATEISKTVNEKVKDGTLLNTVQLGVTSTAAKFGTVTTKAWSDLNTAIQGKGGYDSMSGSNTLNTWNDSNSDQKATSQLNDADKEKWASLDDDNWEPIEQVTKPKSSLNKK